MAKNSQQEEWLKVLDSVTLKGVNLAKHWLPKGAALAEKKARFASKEIQDFRSKSRSRKQAVAEVTPRKSRLLWLLPLPLVPATVIALASGQFSVFLASAVASGLFLLGVLLLRKGFQLELNQAREKFQTRANVPFKTLAAITIALATMITAWGSVGHGLPISLAFGIGAFAAFVLLYGLDPRRKNTVVNDFSGDIQEVNKALEKAEKKLLDIEKARQQISEPELKQRLAKIITLGRNILTEIANKPRELQRARKFLNVYLKGANRVVIGYIKADKVNQPHPLENNFRRVLITIEEVFEKQYQHLLKNDLHELDIQIEVLETQLKFEGLA